MWLNTKKGKTNIMVDALSKRHALLSTLGVQIVVFDHIHELYANDFDFSSIFASCQKKA